MAMVKAEPAEELTEPAQPLGGFTRMPLLRQAGALLGIAASVALGVMIVLWSREPNYAMLYSTTSSQDLAQIVEQLERLAITYKLEGNTIRVPADQVHRTRLLLARQGLPASTESLGYELLDREQPFGMSRMMEASRHNRALEGELARTIASLQTVRTARVHIALPKPSAFVRQHRKPSASVVVALTQGGSLSAADVEGIVHLVAASVPELAPERVTVVDQKGRLLTQRNAAGELATVAERLAYRQKVEQLYTERVLALLQPIAGTEGVRAQVSAEIEFKQVEMASENYTPKPEALRSEQTREESRVAGGPEGVPGSLTNQPPPAGQTSGGESAAVLNSSREATRNYELDKTYSHVQITPGEVKRISVAVVLNHRSGVDEEGNPVAQPYTEEELQQITRLVQDAVGYDPARGDQVVVSNLPFTESEQDVAPPLPIWQQPWLWNLLRQFIGPVLLLLLAVMVLRPVLRNLTAPPPLPPSQSSETDALPALSPEELAKLPPEQRKAYEAEIKTPEEQQQADNEETDDLLMLEDEESYEKRLDRLREVVNENPARAAQVVKGWLNENG